MLPPPVALKNPAYAAAYNIENVRADGTIISLGGKDEKKKKRKKSDTTKPECPSGERRPTGMTFADFGIRTGATAGRAGRSTKSGGAYYCVICLTMPLHDGLDGLNEAK